MTAQQPTAHPHKVKYEALRKDMFLIYVGIGLLILGVSVFQFWTPNWTWSVPSYGIWLIIGGVVTAGGFALWGAASAFKHRTPKMLTNDQMFQLSSKAKKTLMLQDSPINKARVIGEEPSVLKTTKNFDELADGIPGNNCVNSQVPVEVRGLGGMLAYGFHIDPGDEGFLYSEGVNKMIDLNESLFNPYDIEALDHTQVPAELLAKIQQNHSKFVPGKSAIFRTLGLSEPVRRWIRIQPDVRAEVLDEMGIDNLAREFLAYFLADPKIQALMAKSDVNVASLMVNAVSGWLNKQQGIRMVLDGWDEKVHYMTYCYALLSEIASMRLSRQIHIDTIAQQDQNKLDSVRRQGALSGNQIGAPNYLMNERKPYDSTER